MEEKGSECNSCSGFNSDMDIASSISVQLHHCCVMVHHLHPCFTFPLGKCSQASRQTTMEITNTYRIFLEDVLRWMFHVTVDENWFVFARTLVGLLLLSYIGAFFDFLTLVYIGITMVMIVPVIYMKYGDQIQRSGEKVKGEMGRFYEIFDEKVVRQRMSKFVKQEKEKKNV
ncbi:hypothetical protein V6Z11_A10G105500 [Gossypium hirsutum]